MADCVLYLRLILQECRQKVCDDGPIKWHTISDSERCLKINQVLEIVTDYYFSLSVVPPFESLETSEDIDLVKVILEITDTFSDFSLLWDQDRTTLTPRGIFTSLCAWRVSFDAKVYKNLFLATPRGELVESFSSIRFNLSSAKPKKVQHVTCRTTDYLISSGHFNFTFKPPFAKRTLRYIQILDDYIRDYKCIHYIPDYGVDQKVNTSYLRGNAKAIRRATVHNILVKFYNRYKKGDKSVFITYSFNKSS